MSVRFRILGLVAGTLGLVVAVSLPWVSGSAHARAPQLQKTTPEKTTIEYLVAEGEALQTRPVTVRGFLVLAESVMRLFATPEMAQYPLAAIDGRPELIVWDTTLGHRMHWPWDNPCVSAYVEVTGRYLHRAAGFGQLVYELHEIRVWPDSRFEGPGIVCMNWRQDGFDPGSMPELLGPGLADGAAAAGGAAAPVISKARQGGQMIVPQFGTDDAPARAETVTALVRRADRAQNKVVRLRGFLFLIEDWQESVSDADLYLAADNPYQPGRIDPSDSGPVIRVLDNSGDTAAAADRADDQTPCPGHYAELVGGFSHSPVGDRYLIHDLREIRVFEDDRYDGEGQVCYRKDAGAYEYFPMVPGLY